MPEIESMLLDAFQPAQFAPEARATTMDEADLRFLLYGSKRHIADAFRELPDPVRILAPR